MSIPKGAIIITDGNGTVDYLPIGANGQVLIFDSAATKGVKWGAQKQLLKATATGTSSTNSTSYAAILSITILGENVSAVSSIKVLSKLDGNATSYDIRVYDVTNNNVIGTVNATNANTSIVNIGTLSNLPATEAIFEIQARKNGGNNNSYAYIYEATIENTQV